MYSMWYILSIRRLRRSFTYTASKCYNTNWVYVKYTSSFIPTSFISAREKNVTMDIQRVKNELIKQLCSTPAWRFKQFDFYVIFWRNPKQNLMCLTSSWLVSGITKPKPQSFDAFKKDKNHRVRTKFPKLLNCSMLGCISWYGQSFIFSMVNNFSFMYRYQWMHNT